MSFAVAKPNSAQCSSEHFVGSQKLFAISWLRNITRVVFLLRGRLEGLGVLTLRARVRLSMRRSTRVRVSDSRRARGHLLLLRLVVVLRLLLGR